MGTRRITGAAAAVLLAVMSAGAPARGAEPAPRKLVVGTKVTPPFVLKGADGEWSGISIELWRRIAAELDLRFELREHDLEGLLRGVGDGSLDLAVAAVTITPEREQRFDFTHPFHTTGLGIAVPAKPGGPGLSALRKVVSGAFFKAVAALGLLLLGVGLVVWAMERKKNPAQFGGPAWKGIGAAFWWSAVTMTTVGYGDKAPATLGGRVVAIVWMFAAILLISSFTAAIASALTVSQLDSPVKGFADLARVRVGTVEGTANAHYLNEKRVSFRGFRAIEEGLAALHSGDLDAFVYDAPILRYFVKSGFENGLTVLPRTFLRQDYGFALPSGSPLREPVNGALLKIIREDEWQDTLFRYLGA